MRLRAIRHPRHERFAIITGANSGVGLVSARELARNGANVTLACRNQAKALAAISSMVDEHGIPRDRLSFMALDTSSLESVFAFVEAYLASGKPLHLLMLNAGIMGTPFSRSPDGLESQFATNHLGHFALTQGLLGLLERQEESSRVVVVASSAHEWHYSHYNWAIDYGEGGEGYDRWLAYGSTKLANVLFAQELAARLAGGNIYVNTAHPGFVQSGLLNVEHTWGALINRAVVAISSLIQWAPEDGALTQLFLAASPEVESGEGIRGEYYALIARPAATHPAATGDRAVELREDLWRVSEGIVEAFMQGRVQE